MNKVTLYKRNAKGVPLSWSIWEDSDTIFLEYGLYLKDKHIESVSKTLVKANEVQSRINAKRKEGYKFIEELKDDNTTPVERIDVYNFLNTYLPKYNTSTDGFVLPMLAKTLDLKGKEDISYIGQYKIDGLRCLIGAVKANDLFTPITLTYHSRTGEDWTDNMSWMDEVLLPSIKKPLLEMMVEEGAYLDGELYIPGYSVNLVNSFVKNNELPEHTKLQYWCYDIAVDNIPAEIRTEIRQSNIDRRCYTFLDKAQHLNNKSQFVLVPDLCDIASQQHAARVRDNNIKLGFEGLILRNPNSEYQFGKRNAAMFKYKKIHDGYFEIVDIKEDKRGLPIYTLRNDINDELFDCTINLPQKSQKAHLQVKNTLIGKKAFVEFRDRSGVKQVPFHAKIINICI